MLGALGIGIGHGKYIKYWQRAEFLEDYSHHYIQLFHIDHWLTGIIIASPPPKGSIKKKQEIVCLFLPKGVPPGWDKRFHFVGT